MYSKIGLSLLVAILAGTLSIDQAQAQRRRFDPTEFLKRLDTNGNGQIDPDEGSGRARGFIDQMATRAGLDPKQPLPLDKLAESAQTRSGRDDDDDDDDDNDRRRDRDDDDDDNDRDRRRDRDRDDDDDDDDDKKPADAPAPSGVMGFGVATELALPPGFDVPLEKSSRYSRPLEERFDRNVLERADQILREHDQNKNGVLEYKAGEGSRQRWQFPPEQSDKNADGKLDREELCYRIAKIVGSRERESKDDDSKRGGSGGGSSGGDSNDAQQKVRRFAEGLMRQNDKNRNGQIDRDEFAGLREAEKYDANNDKTITLDEMVAKLSSYGRDDGGSNSAQTASTGEGRRGGRGGRSGDKDGDGKKSYRFSTPLERLPKGLPSWFARNDADGDGQVTMSEYSSSYNDATVAEFLKFDLNGDGHITPAECLQAEASKTASAKR